MKLRLCVLVLIAIVPLVCRAGFDAGSSYSIEAWLKLLEQLRDFDEIRMTLAERSVEEPDKWVAGKLTYRQRWVLDTPLHAQKDIKDPQSFIALLELDSSYASSAHGCHGLFNLYFYKKGERIGHLHYAHGMYWAPITRASQERISAWLAARGFPVTRLIEDERERANKSLQPTATAVMPPAGLVARRP
jgi:hypothetical protein